MAVKEKKRLSELANIFVEMKAPQNFVDIFKKAMPGVEIAQNTTFKELMLLSQMGKAVKGDSAAFNILKEFIISKEDTEPQADSQKAIDKVDFETFCINASYPKPYKKQIEFLEFGYAGGFRMVEASRGYGKTDYAAILYPAYQIYLDHSKTFILFGKSRDKAVPAIKEIARSLEANGIILETDSTHRIRVKGHTGKQDNVKAMGVKQSIKGNHPDFIICDDIVDIQDRYSKAERNFLRSFYDAISGLCGNVLFLGQPVFYKDLYSEIRAFIKVLSLPHGTIVELDHDLEARRAAGISEDFINANYHLIVSGQSSLPFGDIKEVDFYPFASSFMWIDPSDGKGDYTAISVMSRHFDKLIFCGFCFDKAWYECDKEIQSIYKNYKTDRAGIEINNLGNHPVIVLRRNGLNFGGKVTTKNKEAKIQNAASFSQFICLSTFINTQGLTEQEIRALKEANALFNQQVREYEYSGAEHDDAPDNIASCLDYQGIINMEKR